MQSMSFRPNCLACNKIRSHTFAVSQALAQILYFALWEQTMIALGLAKPGSFNAKKALLPSLTPSTAKANPNRTPTLINRAIQLKAVQAAICARVRIPAAIEWNRVRMNSSCARAVELWLIASALVSGISALVTRLLSRLLKLKLKLKRLDHSSAISTASNSDSSSSIGARSNVSTSLSSDADLTANSSKSRSVCFCFIVSECD